MMMIHKLQGLSSTLGSVHTHQCSAYLWRPEAGSSQVYASQKAQSLQKMLLLTMGSAGGGQEEARCCRS